MREPAGDDGSKLNVRGYLLAMSEKPGGEKWLDRVEGPPVPEPLAYLWRWFLTLDGMRRYGMGGAEPLTPDQILAADALYGWGLDRLEVDAVRTLDAALRHPGDEETTEPEPVEPPAWPTRKG